MIDSVADIRGLRTPAATGLPLAELSAFGFELLIRKGLDLGLEDAFARSEAYRAHAAEREAAGLA